MNYSNPSVRITRAMSEGSPKWLLGKMALYDRDANILELAGTSEDHPEDHVLNANAFEFVIVDKRGWKARLSAPLRHEINTVEEALEHELFAWGYAEPLYKAITLLLAAQENARIFQRRGATWTLMDCVACAIDDLYCVGAEDLPSIRDILAIAIAGLNSREVLETRSNEFREKLDIPKMPETHAGRESQNGKAEISSKQAVFAR